MGRRVMQRPFYLPDLQLIHRVIASKCNSFLNGYELNVIK